MIGWHCLQPRNVEKIYQREKTDSLALWKQKTEKYEEVSHSYFNCVFSRNSYSTLIKGYQRFLLNATVSVEIYIAICILGILQLWLLWRFTELLSGDISLLPQQVRQPPTHPPKWKLNLVCLLLALQEALKLA